MKKILIFLLIFPAVSRAQIVYPFGHVIDSITFHFTASDSLRKTIVAWSDTSGFGTSANVSVGVDTTAAHLWRIGQTLKPVFSNDTLPAQGIMTDTLHPYPRNADDYFVLKIGFLLPNVVIDIWHRYQADSLHAGGIIEYSVDNGSSWLNIASCPYVLKVNCYSGMDTLLTGQPAFTGKSNGTQLSRFQFMNCEIIGRRQTDATCIPLFFTADSIYVRFRFVSDSTSDSLSGWMIDSIRVENPGCIFVPGGVIPVTAAGAVQLYPNPVADELTISAASPLTSFSIINPLGKTLKTLGNNAAKVEVDVADLPPGLYFVKIDGSGVYKFVKQ